MPRKVAFSLSTISRLPQRRGFVSGRRLFASTQSQDKGSQNSTPGWEGRHGDDHALHRDANDAQADASHAGRKDHEQGKGGQATSRKDEGDHNKRAKKDMPEAPEPVIGMNSERGGKGH